MKFYIGLRMNLLDCFDQIYIINLRTRKDRRQHILSELGKLGLSLSFPRVQIFNAIRPQSENDFPSIGSYGAFLSHLAVLKEALKDNCRNVLVMEDDLTFSPYFIAHQQQIALELINCTWDFAYLGHIEKLAKVPNFQFEESIHPLITAHFYGVSCSIIPALIEFLELILTRPAGHPQGGPMHVDGAFSTFRQNSPHVSTKLANPSLGWQYSSSSDITPKWFDRIFLLKKLANYTRNIKSQWKK